MQLNTLGQDSTLVKAWTLKPKGLNSNHSSDLCYLCVSGKETIPLRALVSSSITWEKLEVPHKVEQKLKEIPNACKKDIAYLQILCKEGAETEGTTWQIKMKWKFMQQRALGKSKVNERQSGESLLKVLGRGIKLNLTILPMFNPASRVSHLKRWAEGPDKQRKDIFHWGRILLQSLQVCFPPLSCPFPQLFQFHTFNHSRSIYSSPGNILILFFTNTYTIRCSLSHTQRDTDKHICTYMCYSWPPVPKQFKEPTSE